MQVFGHRLYRFRLRHDDDRHAGSLVEFDRHLVISRDVCGLSILGQLADDVANTTPADIADVEGFALRIDQAQAAQVSIIIPVGNNHVASAVETASGLATATATATTTTGVSA